MWSEVLKIIPKVDGATLGAMETSLKKRFDNVAKKFGKGIVASIAGGGIVGAAVGLLNKLLSPLQSLEDSINRTLENANQTSISAQEFGTSSGQMARLQAFAKANGVDQGELGLLLEKFQSAVANAALNPDQPTAVSNFVGQKDMAEAFFQFIQSVKKLDPVVQNLVRQEVFGQREIFRASGLFNADFKGQNSLLGGDSAKLTEEIASLNKAKQLQDLLSGQRDMREIDEKSKLITPKVIGDLENYHNQQARFENKDMTGVQAMIKLQMTIDQFSQQIRDMYTQIAKAGTSSGFWGKAAYYLLTDMRDLKHGRGARGAQKSKEGK